MNGCLIKMLILVLIVGVTLSIAVNRSDSVKGEFDKAKTFTEIFIKMIKYRQ